MELDVLWAIAGALLLGGWVSVFWFTKRVNEWYYVGKLGELEYPLPPGDLGLPFVGNMLSFFTSLRSGDPNLFLQTLVTRYGKSSMYKTHLFGCPSIIVCTPELCRHVLTNDEHFGLGYPKSAYLLTGEKSLHNITIAEHLRLRRLIAPPINGHESLATYIPLIEEVVMNSLDEWASMKRPFELYTEMKTATFKVMTHIFMGSVNDSTFWTKQDLFADYIDGMVSPVIDLPGFPFHKALKARKELVKLLQSVLNEKKVMPKSNDQPKAKKDMIDLLMEVEDEDGQKLEDEHVVDLLLAFLAAGFNSSALTTLWALLHLYERPEILKKAKEEQDEIIKRRPSTQKGLNLKEIKEMDFLAKVIDEMLRMTHGLSIFREAKVDVAMHGYTIPKGWKVLVWTGAVHMDPETYENPTDFNPLRWDK
ncbi:beta-amyrin 11-oxidase-like [Juglans microcarpa x Juglans regia]|uniref:beta-amyrin 11-oxidase-like n=1 Tax=Juglans microcarpa x Juglans regia TaxID=2249226 RepID=UPI001B7E9AFE|nr:beta-amyrin 11-oxidase-like [Juglans microcarpa x Juglans regia]